MSCKAQGWPNKKGGRTCCLSFPTKVTNYYRKKVTINSMEELVELHKKDSKDQADSLSKRQGRTIRPDDNFLKWSVNRGVCPYGIISPNTKYWLELMSVVDGEMGVNLPAPYGELPAVFFDVLRIYRENRPVETPKDTNGSKNN